MNALEQCDLFRCGIAACFGLLSNHFLGKLQALGPLKFGSFGRVVTGEVSGETSLWLCVSQFGVAENFAAELSKSCVIFHEFLTGVHVVVVVVVFAIVVEP
jgi:hypothetical protein